MADLGNLHFGIKLDLTDSELDDVVRRVQARLDRNKIKLGVEYDKSSVESLVEQINKAKESASKISVQKTTKADNVTEKVRKENRKLGEENQKREEAAHEQKLKNLAKEIEVASKQARVRADAFRIVDSNLNYSRTQSIVSLPYDDASYKNKMNQMREYYMKEERFAKEKEKQRRTDAKISSLLQKEEEKAQKEYLANLEKQAKAIQQQQVQKQRALDFQMKQEEAQRRHDEKERARYDNMIARSKKNHAVQFTDYESVEYKNKMNQMREYYRQQERYEKGKASNTEKSIQNIVRITKEVKRLENEINKLSLDSRIGGVAGSRTDKAIANLREYKRVLEDAAKGINTKNVLGNINDGSINAAINQARNLSREQRILNQQREAAARAANLQRNEILRLSHAHANEYRLMGQLRNQFFNVYSVYEAERFLRSVIEIGGEFQKQHIALRAMLGDVSKADAMFGKIKELAIESPFNFRELMGFTKQISAFGIPYEEMYETTKRLADISAGLGVDMGRIILAFGQVRSSAVLRGQELRQFTDVGIPLVDELAKKFSELEGRVVSAGEVFEKISNREVSFGMVKDILWQMTNEGGRFFNMQEQLTESVSGKLAKLQDSWEMMLGSIAEGNSGIIGGVIDKMTELTNKWEEAVVIIKSLIAAYGAYKATMFVISAVKAVAIKNEIALTGAITANTIAEYRRGIALTKTNAGAISLLATMERLKVAMASMSGGGWWAAGIALVTAMCVGLYNAYQNATKLNRELDNITSNALMKSSDEAAGFEQLVEKLNHLVKGSKEYNDVIDTIQNKYGSYLSNIRKEEYSYASLKTEIDNVTQALKNKAREEARQQGKASISEYYNEDISESSKKLEDILVQRKGASRDVARAMAIQFKHFFAEELTEGKMPGSTDILNTILKSYGLDGDVFTEKMVDGKIKFNSIGFAANALGEILTKQHFAIKKFNDGLNSISMSSAEQEIEKIQQAREKLARTKVFSSDKEKEDFQLETLRMQLNAIKDIAGSSDLQNKLNAQIDTIIRFRDTWIQTANELGGKVGKSFVQDLLPNADDKNKRSLLSYLDRLRNLYKSEQEELNKAKASGSDQKTEEDKKKLERLEARVQFIKELFSLHNTPIEIQTAKQEESEAAKQARKAEQEARKALQAELKAIKDEIDDITNKWKTFQSVLDKTGNKQFAAQLAFGDIAVGESQMMKDFRKVIEEGIKGVVNGVGGDNPFDLFLGMTDFQIEELSKATGTQLQLLKPYADAYKKAQRELRKDTADTLVELVTEYQDYADKIKAIETKKEEDIRRLNENRSTLEKSGVDVDKLIKERTDTADKEKGNVVFEKFKETKKWAKVFGNLDRVSNATIDHMITSIKEFSKTQKLSVEDTKELMDALEKLNGVKGSRNPFKAFSDAQESVKKAKDKLKALKSSGGSEADIRNAEDDLKDARANEALAIEGIIGKFNKLADAASLLGGIFENLGLGSGLSDAAGIMGGALSSASSIHGIASAFGATGPWGAAAGAALGLIGGIAGLHDKKLDKAIQRSKQRVEELRNAYQQIEDSIERGVGGMNRSLMYYEQLKKQSELAGVSLSESYSKAYSVLQDGGKKYIAGIRSEMSKISVRDYFFNNNMKFRLNKELLQDLEAAGVGSNNLSNEQLKQKQAQYVALLEQRKEIQQQMRDEEGKKDTDEGKIADYQNQLAQLNMQIGTFVGDLAKEMFGIDFEGWSGQITDALVEAFANGEDAAEAFSNVTNSIIRGVANNILKSMVIQPMFEKLQKKLFGDENGKGAMFQTFKDLEKNGEKLTVALKDFFDKEGGAMINASQTFLESLDKATGGAITATGDKNGKKEGLSAGIQGVTEETADLLASYVNAVRADVAAKRALQEKFFNDDFPKMNAIAQAQLQQLNIIAKNTGRNVEFVEEIRDILHRNVNGANKFNI